MQYQGQCFHRMRGIGDLGDRPRAHDDVVLLYQRRV